MIINAIVDSTGKSDPSFMSDMNAAINIYEALFPENITVNIVVGDGEFEGTTLSNQHESVGNIVASTSLSYSTLRSDLIAANPTFFNSTNLPNTTSIAGYNAATGAFGNASSFTIGGAQEKLFGILSPTGSEEDGAVGIGTTFTPGGERIGAFLHELGHALGRDPGTELDLFRFLDSNSSERLFNQSPGNPSPSNPTPGAYFSIDGGATSFAQWGQTSDPSDFMGTSQTNDPYDETILSGASQLTLTDEDVMQALGFSQALNLSYQGQSLQFVASGDYNGSSSPSDMLFQRSDGTPIVWVMNGQVGTEAILPDPGPSWRAIATGDFDGGNESGDMLFQNTNGTPAIWIMDGTSIAQSSTLGNPGSSWQIKTTGDFNSDGYSDILWQNVNGTPAIWEMSTFTAVVTATLPNPGTAWQIKATGDFFDTGFANSILWQNTNGTPAIWLMNGPNVAAAFTLPNPTSSWKIIGTGDFSHDGFNDGILFQNNNGQPAIWIIHGSTLVNAFTLPNPGTSWHITGIGDFNADGNSDIFWENSNGTTAVWLMNGGQMVSSQLLSTFGATATGASNGTASSVAGSAVPPPAPAAAPTSVGNVAAVLGPLLYQPSQPNPLLATAPESPAPGVLGAQQSPHFGISA
jgi:hypothetical protein